ncbi:MAG: GAF domain-containing protein, partial [Myxococcota bacterium]
MSDGAPVAEAQRDLLGALSAVFAEAVVDEQRLLDAIVEHVAGYTGDTCVVRLLQEDGSFPAAAVYNADPTFRSRIREIARATQPDPSVGVWRTLLRDRAPVRVALSPDRLPPGMSDVQASLFVSTPATHFLGVPLVARGRVLGGILVVRCTRTDAHTDAEVALLRELGARAALAIDNARLWSAERAARQRAERAEVALRAELAERLKAEDRLRESEEQLRLFFHNVVDYAMVLLDRDGRVVSWNAGAERMTGWPAAEVVGGRVALLGPPGVEMEARLAEVLDRVRREGRAEIATSASRRDGTSYELHAVVT